VEVDHGRAARAGAQDKAAAEARVAHRRRRRRGIAGAILVALLVAELGVIGYRHLYGPPSLAVGSHANVTMRMASSAYDCRARNPADSSSFTYGGVRWEPLAFFPASWGTTGPWKGTLNITAPVRSHALTQHLYVGGPTSAEPNGTFTYRGTSIPLAAPPYLSTGPIC
jgi:hypothetical protein